MTNLPTFNIRAAKRLVCVMLAALLAVAALPMFQPNRASAAQITNRSIKISDSAPSGGSITTGVGSGTNVTYEVSFTATTAAQSLIIDFCQETPLMGGPCTRPTGMVTNSATLTAVSGQVGTGWSIDAAPPRSEVQTNGRVMLKSDGAHPLAAGAQTFDLTGITNPSSVGSFYARVYTFSDVAYGTYCDPDTSVTGPASCTGGPGSYVDFGGIALSTVNVITITAKVQEQLTFCLTKAIDTSWANCSDAVVGQASNKPALTLGHLQNNVLVLDSSAVDTATIYSQLSTNAINGAVVRLRNSNNTCAQGGLSDDGGTTCAIPAVGATNAAITAGTADFGLHVESSAAPSGTTVGSLTDSPVYYNAAHTAATPPMWYGMDITTAGNNVDTTYGSTLCSTTGPIYRINTHYTFAATAALTTPAGIYTANMSMIATGTF